MTFWRNVEALSPQQLPKSAPQDAHEPTRDWVPGALAPWMDPDFERRPVHASMMWRHAVYAAVYQRPIFIERLEKRLGKQPGVFDERPTGQSCVFSVAFDEHGRPLVETFMLSMAAWAFGVVETHGLKALASAMACDTDGLHAPAVPLNLPPSNSGFPGFDFQLDKLREELAWRLGSLPEGTPVNGAWFADFTRLVIDKCKLANLGAPGLTHRIKSVLVRRPKRKENADKPKTDDDFLNSFFIKDLNRLLDAGLGGAGEGLRRYLEPPKGMKRIDARKDRAKALDLLSPRLFPAGCWPAEHPLVWSQQLAINAMWEAVGQSAGAFAVNGPPGTGKTTLLRDIVAAVAVERARLLAEHGSALFGERRFIQVGSRPVPYYLLDEKLTGFSIVVASSNNGAVENVSLELPRQNAIHAPWLKDVDAFRDIASVVLGQPAWAMIAGRLGNKSNRSEFVSKFWWGPEKNGVRTPALRERLDAIVQDRAQPAVPWEEAVKRFNAALAEEQAWRGKLVKLQGSSSFSAMLTQKRDKESAEQRRNAANRERDLTQRRIESLSRQIAAAEPKLTALRKRLDVVKGIRPGLLDWMSTLGVAHRQWRDHFHSVMSKLQPAEDAHAAKQNKLAAARQTLSQIEQRILEFDQTISGLARKLKKAETQTADARALLGENWPDLDAPVSEQERSSPWALPDWRSARIRVFLAALDLHRAFIEANADKMMKNLALAMDVLGGSVPDGKTRQIALDSLAIACPVISTTFASVASLFGDLGAGTLGWLLIDEAGQAAPQAAAGAIWRARRVIVVGDPRQLEPVVTTPPTIEASLAAFSGDVAQRWRPSMTSVQVLADQTTPVGTTIGKGEDALWVGAPLRVHRRCDDPMFSISNAIAYDGLMVHQKQPAVVALPGSCWIDVRGGANDGAWFPDEGKALEALLGALINTHRASRDDIFLVSPFRDVVRQLRSIGDRHGLNKARIGTVHTTQGKEASVVIMVLGGGAAGARDWAASKPNLLNVAVSRAKARLYVIGDRRDWSARRYFDVLSKKLN
jgi:predicted  nucleic acid-binding Zn-ribbon protein